MVRGLACPFCVYGLEKHLRKLPGATAVRVDLGKGEATIELAADSKVTEEQIRKAVKNAGFTADRIEWQVHRTTRTGPGEAPRVTPPLEGEELWDTLQFRGSAGAKLTRDGSRIL